jgi:hypothetical protein
VNSFPTPVLPSLSLHGSSNSNTKVTAVTVNREDTEAMVNNNNNKEAMEVMVNKDTVEVTETNKVIKLDTTKTTTKTTTTKVDTEAVAAEATTTTTTTDTKTKTKLNNSNNHKPTSPQLSNHTKHPQLHPLDLQKASRLALVVQQGRQRAFLLVVLLLVPQLDLRRASRSVLVVQLDLRRVSLSDLGPPRASPLVLLLQPKASQLDRLKVCIGEESFDRVGLLLTKLIFFFFCLFLYMCFIKNSRREEGGAQKRSQPQEGGEEGRT